MKHRIMALVVANNETMQDLAKILGVSYGTLSKKLNEHVEFNRNEIDIIRKHFNLNPQQLVDIFFE